MSKKLKLNDFLSHIGNLLLLKHAEDIVVLDVKKITSITDYVIICTSKSTVQSKAITDYIRQELKDNEASKFQTNQELFGQGLANISSSLSGSYPVSGSFSRSSVSVTANGFSGFTSIVTSITVGLTLLYATDLLFYLPQATLGVIIILAVLPLIEFRKMKEMYKDNTK